MSSTVAMFLLPADPELWIVLAYIATLVIAARVVEGLARMHFERARRYGEQGFEYVESEDHYRCAGGERLLLHVVDEPSRLAIYRASASRCNGCPMKKDCTSHDDGRMVFRSLATWSESDVGWFHQRISAVMFAAGGMLCAVELYRRAEDPGKEFLLLGLLICLTLLIQDLAKLGFFRWLNRIACRAQGYARQRIVNR
jgi:hypothetical protein